MIVCLGTTPALQRTLVFSQLKLDSVNRAIEVHEYASGKSINVARVAHTLREKVIATGILGGDRASLVRRDLDRAGIPHDFLDVDAPTRMCVTVIDSQAHSATELVEESSPARSSDAARLLDHLKGLLASAKVLVMSGTLAPNLGDDFYGRCVKLARDRNVQTIVDAKGAALERAAIERPTVLKPNRNELVQTFGADHRAAIARCIELGAQWAVVTDGPRETIVSNGREFWKLDAPAVALISPIGSGDALAAGIAVGIVRGQSIPDACTLGVACGAANAMTALAGHVDRETVQQLQQRNAPVRL
jgi:1-phosphofructokinase family hexose kinase